MTHKEQKTARQQTARERGDPRVLLLAATPPAERSEVAARHDHAIEARELDKPAEPSADNLSRLKMELWRASVAVELAESGRYRDCAMRYLGGHLISPGMAREIGEAEARTPMPSDAEVLTEWHAGRKLRREYIRQRYGV